MTLYRLGLLLSNSNIILILTLGLLLHVSNIKTAIAEVIWKGKIEYYSLTWKNRNTNKERKLYQWWFTPTISRQSGKISVLVKEKLERTLDLPTGQARDVRFATAGPSIKRTTVSYSNGESISFDGNSGVAKVGKISSIKTSHEFVGATWEVSWSAEQEVEVVEEKARNESTPHCCENIDFRCATLRPADIVGFGGDPDRVTNQCEAAQAIAKKRCKQGNAFRESYHERHAVGDDGDTKLRVLVIDVSGSKVAVSMTEVGQGLKLLLSNDVRYDPRGAEYFNFDDGPKVSKPGRDLWDALTLLSVGDGSPENIVARAWRSKEEMARAYLKQKLIEQKNSCQHGSVVVIDDPVMASMLAGFFENSGTPEIKQTLLDMGEMWKVAGDRNQSMTNRVLAVGATGIVGITALFKAKGMSRIIEKQIGRLRIQHVDFSKKIKALQKAAQEAPDETTKLLLKEQEENLRKLVDGVEQRGRAIREIVDELENDGVTRTALRMLAEQDSTALSKEAMRLAKEIEKLKSEIKALPKTSLKRAELEQAVVVTQAARNIHHEAIGEKGLEQAYRIGLVEKRPKGYLQPLKEQRHGPDEGLVTPPRIGFKDEKIDVLVEAKGISKERYDSVIKPPPGSKNPHLRELLKHRKSAHPFGQHSPAHIKAFARERLRISNRRIHALQNVKPTNAKQIAAWKTHRNYWKSIHQRSLSGTNIRLELVATNVETRQFTRFRYDYANETWKKIASGRVAGPP